MNKDSAAKLDRILRSAKPEEHWAVSQDPSGAARELLDYSERLFSVEPKKAVAAAKAAYRITDNDQTRWLHLEAMAQLGFGLVAIDGDNGGEKLCQSATEMAQNCENVDLNTLGKIKAYRSRVHWVRDEYNLGLRMATEAFLAHVAAGDMHRGGVALVLQGVCYHCTGMPKRAYAALQSAAQIVDEKRDPRVLVMLGQTLAYVLIDLDEPARAAELARSTRRSPVATPLDRLRLLDTESRALYKLGKGQEAVVGLTTAMDEFAERDLPLDAAESGLGAVIALADAARFDEAISLASQVAAICNAGGMPVRREASYFQLRRSLRGRDTMESARQAAALVEVLRSAKGHLGS